jgi:ribosomal protein L11 methyltransferase
VESATRQRVAASARFVARCADSAAGEILAAEAWAAGAQGVEEREAGRETEIVIYAPADRIAEVRAAVAGVAGEAAVAAAEAVPDRDWSEEWKAGLAAVEVSPRLVVRPSFVEHRLAPGQHELVVDPGQAFGTGGHASTRLALEWIDAVASELPPDASALDVGTGTGILALAVIRLAGARVVAFDLDPLAPAAARENALVNRVAGGLDLYVGGLAALREVRFDLVLANLLKRELLPLAGGIAARTRPGGFCVLSGLLASDVPEVSEAFAAGGFRAGGSRTTADPGGELWTALLMLR